jgi:predicted nuclease of predicted toxin-antitoxin system
VKFLIDSCVSPQVARALSAAGHDVDSVAGWEKDPGDEEILAAANRDQRILITLDLGFGDLIFRDNARHSGLLRLAAMDPDAQVAVCLRAIGECAEELRAGDVVVANRKRTRVRRG